MTSDAPNPGIISSTLSLGAFSGICMVLGLASTVIITRHFPPEQYGVYVLILVIVAFLGQISTFGLELSVSKFISGAKDEISKEHFLGTAVIIRTAAILLTSLLAWYGGPLLKLLFGQSLLPGFIFYVPLLFAMEEFRSLLRATLQGSLLFKRMGITDLIASSIFLILVVLVITTNGNIPLLILARILSSFLACVFAFVSIPIRKHIFFHSATFNELMKFGYPLYINDILFFIFSRIDTVAVAIFLGPAEIAMYEVARKIPDYLRNLYEPFRSVYYPFIAKHYALNGQQQAAPILNAALRFVAFVTLLGTAIAALFGREILQLVFTQKYSSGAPVFTILMFNLSIALISNVMGNTLVAVGDTQKPAIINFFNAVISWVGSFLLVPVYALVGASVANAIGTAVAFPLNRYFLRKRIGLEDMPYLKPIILLCVWGLLVFLIKPEMPLIKAAFLVVYILGCIFLSIVTKADIALLIAGSGISSSPRLRKLRLWISGS